MIKSLAYRRVSLAWLAIFAFVTIAPSQAPARSWLRHDASYTVNVDGTKRRYLIHEPKPTASDASTPVPQKPKSKRSLVIVLHGGLGNAATARWDTKMSMQSDQDGFLVAYPDGDGQIPRMLLTWNAGDCCGPAKWRLTQDINFLRLMIKHIQVDYDVDPDRIYIAGFSNGAMLAYRAACEMSDVIAAIAPVSGCMVNEDVIPESPVSILAINGLTDSIIKYNGGTGSMLGYKVRCPAVSDTINFWVKQNHCAELPQRSSEGTVLCEQYTGGIAGSEVCLYSLNGRHIWPGGRVIVPLFGMPGSEFQATKVISDFFQKHPKGRPGNS